MVEDGAKRFVDALNDTQHQSGVFYASRKFSMIGPTVDQSEFFEELNNTEIQDNANAAIHSFIN